MNRPPLVLHSSLLRLSLQATTPVLMLALGITGLVNGSGAAPVVLTALGIVAALVVTLDLPVCSEFSQDGITRVCPLRRQHLPWSRVVAVERIGGDFLRRDHDPSPTAGRGLAARTGSRRVHLLVDRRESHAEWEQLSELMRDRATRLRAKQPPMDAAPAGRGPRALHRRRGS